MKHKPSIDIVWDVETYKTIEEDGSIVNRIYLIGWASSDNPTQFFYSLEPHTEFFEFLALKYEHYTLNLYAFNANYDLLSLYPFYLSKYFGRHKLIWKVSDSKTFIKFNFKTVKGLMRFSFKCFCLYVWDKTKSLNDYYKLLQIEEKKSIHYDKWDCTYYLNKQYRQEGFWYYEQQGKEDDYLKFVELKEELDYLKIDVLGLFEVLSYQKRLKANVCNYLGLTSKHFNKKTSASFAKFVWNEILPISFNKLFRPITTSLDIYNCVYGSLMGGFTAYNKDILEYVSLEGKIWSYDVNSMYPFIMSECIPIGPVLPKKDKEWQNYICWILCEASFCEWDEEFAFLSQKPISERILVAGSPFFLLEEYWLTFKDHVKTNLKIIEKVYQETSTVLGDGLKDLYEKRRKAKQEGKKEEEQAIKLIINCTYGKLAEKCYMKETFYNEQDLTFKSEETFLEEFPLVFSGIYVAQKGRSILISNIIKETRNGNKFLYCDTDSIKLVLENKPLLDVDNQRLGGWKAETSDPEGLEGYTHFRNNKNAKKYLMFNQFNLNSNEGLKLVFSGIKKNICSLLRKHLTIEQLWDLFNPEENYLIVRGSTLNKRNKYGQAVIFNKDVQINARLKKITKVICFDGYEKTWLIKNYDR